jgi:cytoskeletal protein CcmA (bactofilin family)
MFGKGSETSGGEKHAHSILQDGISVRGSLEVKGDVRLDGRLEGNILVSERLTVGASGVLIADVVAGEAIIMGTVEGTIRVHRRLELRKGARVVGDIAAPVLLIEEGVHFHGNCDMRHADSPVLEQNFERRTPAASDDPSDEKEYEKIYQ